MFRYLLTLAMGCLLFGSLAANLVGADGPVVQGADPQAHEGMVVSAGSGQVSLRAADGKEHNFKTNDMTRVTVHGKPGKLEDLKPGLQIRVMVDKQGKVISVATVDDRK